MTTARWIKIDNEWLICGINMAVNETVTVVSSRGYKSVIVGPPAHVAEITEPYFANRHGIRAGESLHFPAASKRSATERTGAVYLWSHDNAHAERFNRIVRANAPKAYLLGLFWYGVTFAQFEIIRDACGLDVQFADDAKGTRNSRAYDAFAVRSLA